MNLVRQPPGSKICGQAVVATLMATTIQMGMRLTARKGPTRIKILLDAISEKYNHQTPAILHRVRKNCQLPELAIVRVKWREKGGHWVIHRNGVILDPAFGSTSLNTYMQLIEGSGKITSYIKIWEL